MSFIKAAICSGGRTRTQGPAWDFGHRTRVNSIPGLLGRHLAGNLNPTLPIDPMAIRANCNTSDRYSGLIHSGLIHRDILVLLLPHNAPCFPTLPHFMSNVFFCFIQKLFTIPSFLTCNVIDCLKTYSRAFGRL